MLHAPCWFFTRPGRGLVIAPVLPTNVGLLFSGANAGCALSYAPPPPGLLPLPGRVPTRLFLIYNFIVILLCDINIFCNFAVNQYSYGDAGGC